ncbi:MAG: MFS transporter [Candidatus Heimdallarchaeota archaeon]|nr:MFS transporter [Candidatus Heimdallarchaeota archaeon]
MLSKRQKVFYGMCRFGTSIFMQVVTLATIYIYANHFELSQDLNAIGNAVGKIVIAFSGFIFGYISDILPSSKFGRRKIFIWTGAPLLALSFVMLFIPHLFIPIGDNTSVFVWLLIWISLFNLFYGYLLTPYQSWMPEITTEEDRVNVSGYQNTSNLIATVGGLAFVFIIAGGLSEEGISSSYGTFLIFAIIAFAVIEVLMFLPMLLTIEERQVERKERNILREFKVVLKNKNYVIWFIAQGIYSIGLTILLSLTLDLMGFMGLSGIQDFSIFGVLMFGMVIVSFVFWTRLSKKIGKKWSLIIGFACVIVVLPCTLFVAEIPYNIGGYLFGFLLGIGLSVSYLFPYAIIGDIADEDERLTKESRAGMYTGFNSIPLNIFQALALLIIPLIYDPNNPIAGVGLQWLGPIAAGFILLSIPVLWLGNFDPFMIKKAKKAELIEEVEMV